MCGAFVWAHRALNTPKWFLASGRHRGFDEHIGYLTGVIDYFNHTRSAAMGNGGASRRGPWGRSCAAWCLLCEKGASVMDYTKRAPDWLCDPRPGDFCCGGHQLNAGLDWNRGDLSRGPRSHSGV